MNEIIARHESESSNWVTENMQKITSITKVGTVSQMNTTGRLSPYKRIEVNLRTRVREGYWAIGEPLPGRRKLAEEYGVAVSTIQRAVARLIEDGTLQADGALGTFVASPELSAKIAADDLSSVEPLRDGDGKERLGSSVEEMKSLRIGILVDNGVPPEVEEYRDNPFFGPLFDGIRSYLGRKQVYVSYVYRDGRSYQQIHRISDYDGLIIIAPIAQTLWELQILHSTNTPFVALLTSSDATREYMDLPCIEANNREGARQAVNHLLALGHKHIGFVNLALSQTNLSDRLQGYLSALSEANLMVDPSHLLLGSYPWNDFAFEEHIARWVEAMADAGRLPSAIFCCDFAMTLKTLAALQQRGLNVPDDISLIGFDDNPVAEHTSPSLTVVRQPIFQIGRRAAARLVEHLRSSSGGLSGTERLPTQLVIRASTSAPPR